MTERFARKDVVWLLSGGKPMTVESVIDATVNRDRGQLVDCVWFEGGRMRKASFYADLLTRSDPKATTPAPAKPFMPNETERDRA